MSVVALGAIATVARVAPAGQWYFPPCVFHQVTGLHCPGCGGTRAAHALLHGEVVRAVRCNALTIVGLPVFLACVLVWWRRHRPTEINWTTLLPPRLLWTGAWVTAAFFVLRNVPVWPFVFLAPP